MGNQNYKVFWQEALNQLRQEYKAAGEEDVFELWFRMDYVEDDANIIKVSVPSEFMRNQMESKGCFDQISKKLSLLTGQSEIKIETQITNSQISSVSDAEQTPEPFKNQKKQTVLNRIIRSFLSDTLLIHSFRETTIILHTAPLLQLQKNRVKLTTLFFFTEE